MEAPTKDKIIKLMIDEMYSAPILNNAHRGNFVEALVLSALDSDWKLVGLGWHPWDIQRGVGSERIRIQVKQSAAMQLWGKTRNPILKFGWSKKAPSYFRRDNPHEEIESEGWFCELFIFGLHLNEDNESLDQLDPQQWQFMVIPICDLKRGQDSMALKKARTLWNFCSWGELQDAVNASIARLNPGETTEAQ